MKCSLRFSQCAHAMRELDYFTGETGAPNTLDSGKQSSFTLFLLSLLMEKEHYINS